MRGGWRARVDRARTHRGRLVTAAHRLTRAALGLALPSRLDHVLALPSRLDHVLGGVGGVGASGWGVPDHDAGLGLFEPPAGCLLAPVVISACSAEVAFAGGSVRPGDGVV